MTDKIKGALEIRSLVFPNGTRLEYDEATGQVILVRGGGAPPTAFTQTYATASRTHSDPTAANPAAITEYTPHASGAVAVTSAGATDLDTTAAALNTLVDECQALETEVSALVVDMANVKQVLNAVIDDLQALGWLR